MYRQVTSSQDPDKKYYDFEEVPKRKGSYD